MRYMKLRKPCNSSWKVSNSEGKDMYKKKDNKESKTGKLDKSKIEKLGL